MRFVAGVLCAAGVLVFAVGGERLMLWSHCKWWHSTGDGLVSMDQQTFVVPQKWCPIDADAVTLTNVPASREDVPLTVLIASPPESLASRLPDLPTEMTILGERLALRDDLRRETRGSTGVRMVYRRVSSESEERYVAWVFPDRDLMISSFRVPPGKEKLIDELVEHLIAE